MGYPMIWYRLVNRNHLTGGYSKSESGFGEDGVRRMIAGDMRRLETDTRDNAHLAYYSARTGVSPEKVKEIFDIFFRKSSDIFVPDDPVKYEQEYNAIKERLDKEWNMQDVVI